MLTVLIKRNVEPAEIQLTQQNVQKELWNINGSEMLVVDSWREGLKKVRTMYVCLVEGDCTLSANYLMSNYGIIIKSHRHEGGETRFSMLASCLGIDRFDNRIYHYRVEKTKENPSSYQYRPQLEKEHIAPYEAQIGFIPGAIIRYGAIKPLIEKFNWDDKNMVKMSAEVSFHIWSTHRWLRVNPNTTYVSRQHYLADPPKGKVEVPDTVANAFNRMGL